MMSPYKHSLAFQSRAALRIHLAIKIIKYHKIAISVHQAPYLAVPDIKSYTERDTFAAALSAAWNDCGVSDTCYLIWG
jgi:hypothetical protein